MKPGRIMKAMRRSHKNPLTFIYPENITIAIEALYGDFFLEAANPL
jgi:hypothetical protein